MKPSSSARVLVGVLVCLLAAEALRPAWAQDGDAIAIVNGRPIPRRKLVDVLLESHGLPIMQQLIALELAKEETARLKLTVTEVDVEREFRQALAKIAPGVDAQGQGLTDAERQQALEKLLEQKGLTLREFRIGMERNAHLRKAVEQTFRVDEATLREEYARLYGEKVETRHIQVADINGLHEALNQLDKGADFAEIARRVSQNVETASRGGLLEPFAFNDEAIEPVLREAAFALRPGEVSKPIRVGRWWHLIKLERRLPTSGAPFEDVRADVERALRDHAIPEQMNRLITELFRRADVKVLDTELKRKFDQLMKENAAAESATAP